MLSPCTYLESGTLTVEYTINIEHREWGIKGISINIHKVWGDLEAEIDDEATDLLMQDPIVKTFEIEAESDEWQIEVSTDLTDNQGLCICPNSCEIDIEDKRIEVYF